MKARWRLALLAPVALLVWGCGEVTGPRLPTDKVDPEPPEEGEGEAMLLPAPVVSFYT